MPSSGRSCGSPEYRDPRGYIIPSDQPDFLTAIKFINALREVNVTVQRATRDVQRRPGRLSGRVRSS